MAYPTSPTPTLAKVFPSLGILSNCRKDLLVKIGNGSRRAIYVTLLNRAPGTGRLTTMTFPLPSYRTTLNVHPPLAYFRPVLIVTGRLSIEWTALTTRPLPLCFSPIPRTPNRLVILSAPLCIILGALTFTAKAAEGVPVPLNF